MELPSQHAKSKQTKNYAYTLQNRIKTEWKPPPSFIGREREKFLIQNWTAILRISKNWIWCFFFYLFCHLAIVAMLLRFRSIQKYKTTRDSKLSFFSLRFICAYARGWANKRMSMRTYIHINPSSSAFLLNVSIAIFFSCANVTKTVW